MSSTPTGFLEASGSEIAWELMCAGATIQILPIVILTPCAKAVEVGADIMKGKKPEVTRFSFL